MSEITTSYSLTENDFIEATHLQINKHSYLINLYLIVLFISLAWLDFKRIDNPGFFTFDFAERFAVPQTTKDHVYNLITYLLIFVYLFGQTNPKYSPITRWNISKKYQNNFLKQETKTITFDESGIKIVSASYRELRQWEEYTKFAESKKLFLLFGQGSNNMIPKRIFDTEEKLDLFRALLESKIKSQKPSKG